MESIEVELVIVTCISLALFGGLYNHWVASLEKEGRAEGFVSFLVVGGVALTLGGVALLDTVLAWNAALVCLLAFTCSGLPMIIGSVWRYTEARRAMIRRLEANDN